MVPTREIFWNIVGGGWIYPFAALAVGWMVFGIYRRVRLWRLGGSEARFDRLGERFSGLLAEIFGQRRLLRDRYIGTAHLFIFYGFFVELIATTLIAIQEWSGIHFLQGTFYLWFSLFADVFGILGIIGILMVAWRRGVQRPAYLNSSVDDWVALTLLFIVFAQGFVIEGARIAVTVLPLPDNWAAWSPGGYAIALMMQGIDPDTLKALHRSLWWIHAMTAFVFIAYLSYGKLAHIFYGLTNIFMRNLGPSGVLHHPDIEDALENDPDSLDSLGVENIRQFPCKGLMDLDACTNCGRCEQVCPAHGSGVALNPRKLIQDMQGHLSSVGPSLLQASDSDSEGPGGALHAALFGEAGTDGAAAPALSEEELWGCRTCGACQQECPVFIEHVPKIVDMRRYLVMTEAKMSDEAQQFLKNIDDRGYPWVGAAPDREAWFEDLEIKVLGRGDRAEYLFWVGCTGAMMERNIQVTRSVARILTAAEVDFAVLGSEETCSGDPARRVGGGTHLPDLREDEHRDPGAVRSEEDYRHLSSLLQYAAQRVPGLRRPLRGHPSHPVHRGADSGRPPESEAGTGFAHLPRSLLPGPSQWRVRRTARDSRGALAFWRGGGTLTEPLEIPVLRGRGGVRLDGRRSPAAHQP